MRYPCPHLDLTSVCNLEQPATSLVFVSYVKREAGRGEEMTLQSHTPALSVARGWSGHFIRVIWHSTSVVGLG